MTVLDSSDLEARLWVHVCGDPALLDSTRFELDDFADAKAAQAWRAATDLHSRGEPVGAYAIEAWLKAAGEQVPLDYLLECTSRITIISRYELQRLQEIHRLRRVRRLAMQVQAATEAQDWDAASRLLVALQGADEVTSGYPVMSAREAAQAAVQGLFAESSSNTRLTYGLGCLDLSLGPMEAGALTVIGGATGVGKSSLMLSMALGMADAGIRVGIVSCEDPLTTWGRRMAARWAHVDTVALRAGQDDEGWHRLVNLGDECPDPPITIEQTIGATDVEVCAAMRRLVRRNGAQVLMVDYLQTIRTSGRQQKRADQVSETASIIKGQGARLNVSTILGSQLRRPESGKEHHEPSVNAFKETGDIENMAEIALMLWKPDKDDDSKVTLKIAKGKNGKGRPLHPMFRDQTGALREGVPYA